MPSLRSDIAFCPLCGNLPDNLKSKPFWGRTTHQRLECDCGFKGPWAEIKNYERIGAAAERAFYEAHGKKISSPPPPPPRKS